MDANNDFEQTAHRAAEIAREDNAIHWSIDRRIPLPTIFMFGLGVLTFLGGIGTTVFVAGGIRESFANVIRNTAEHETRIRGLEVGLGDTNRDEEGMKGDIRGIKGEVDTILAIVQDEFGKHPRQPTFRPGVP